MRIPEARHAGLWAIRSRLFAASFNVKKEANIKSAADAQFVLQYHYFTKRGEKPVREGPTYYHYDLRIDTGEPSLLHWVMDHDISAADQTVGYLKECKDKSTMTAEGYFPPGTPLNPTKDTAAYVEIVDSGKCVVFEISPDFVKVEFKGGKLKGVWVLTRHNENWLIARSQAAPEAKEIEVAHADSV